MHGLRLYENKNYKELKGDDFDFGLGEFQNCKFEKCDFSGCDFKGSRFIDCKFFDSNLSNIKVINSGFQGVSFINCKIAGIDFARVINLMLAWDFKDCLIEFCWFHGLKMQKTKFIDCQIKEVEFDGVNLMDADFSGTDLNGTKFINSNLCKADFTYAHNYFIDPTKNTIKDAKFKYPGALALLRAFDIQIEY